MIGKGLESLIPKKSQTSQDKDFLKKDYIFWIEVDKIKPNPYQPRKEFNDQELENLAQSIKKYGLLQPIIVTKIEKKNSSGGITSEYEIIAGERRWRASKRVGLKQIPVIIKERTDQEKLEMALIENVQRKNLNPLDKAQAFIRLRKEFNLVDREIGQLVGMSREAVTNATRLFSLEKEIQEALRNEKITEGHAKALLTIKDSRERMKIFNDLLKSNFSVREVEKRAKEAAPERPGILNKLFFEKKVKEVFDYDKVRIERKSKGLQLVFSFETEEQIKDWLKNIMHKKIT